MKHHNQFVRCLENIQDLSGQKLYEYALMLAGGAVHSLKTIKYNKKKDVYRITHHIDDTKETLTSNELKKSNIGKGIKLRSLIAIIN